MAMLEMYLLLLNLGLVRWVKRTPGFDNGSERQPRTNGELQ